MAMCCTLTKRASKRLKEPLMHLNKNTVGCGMLTKLMRYLRRIYVNLRLGFYDYVLLALIVSLSLTQLSVLLSISG